MVQSKFLILDMSSAKLPSLIRDANFLLKSDAGFDFSVASKALFTILFFTAG